MSVALADVNVLLAILDPEHIHHELGHGWLHGVTDSWSTCPLTLNGCLRILSNPSYPAKRRTPAQVAEMVQTVVDHPKHDFWPDSISILEDTIFSLDHVHSGRQLTDVYLLGLAVRRGGHLVTFDRSIPWRAVKGAKASHLKVLSR